MNRPIVRVAGVGLANLAGGATMALVAGATITLVAGATITLVAGATITLVASARQADEAKIYATVIGPNGSPVPRLTAADFVIRENGEDKRILGVGLSTEPLAVELITDRLGGKPEFTPIQMRAGLTAIVHTILAVNPESQISLRTFDSEAVQLVKPTSSVIQLDAVIRKLFSNNGNSVLLDAIADASDALGGAKTPRRAIVALVAGYKGDTSGLTSLRTAQKLRQSRASLWVVEATAAGVSNPNRDVLVSMGTQDSGGFHLTVATGTAIEGAATRIAALLLAQYELTYGAPSPATNRRIDVSVKGDGMRVVAARWAADR